MSDTSDFRSDTVTRPSQRMREAVAQAAVGDDVLDGDPTVGQLEEVAAAFLGKSHALFVPSGTMANQVALGVWTEPGVEVLCDKEAHVVRWEGGALGANHGVQSLTLESDNGVLSPELIRAHVRPDFIHCARTGLLCLEQTHMGSGGRALPAADIDAAALAAKEAGVPVHLDGARLANAAVARGVPAAAFTQHVDSVSLCLSKGLGAPVGSVVAGSAEFIEQARWQRKRLGGWMRQAGLIAAAGLIALEENVERLAEDHALAQALASGFNELHGLSCNPARVETNIVLVDVDHPRFSASELAGQLTELGTLVMALSPTQLRFVTHLDLGPQDAELAIQRAGELLN